MVERVLVVDDEAPARAKVKRFLARDPRFELVGEAGDGAAALAQVRALAPALLVLDIQMPGLTGFEVLEQLEPPRPQVLFATAFDQHALAAFDAHAVDYLLKPYDAPRFQAALDRAWALLQAGKGEPAPVQALLAGLTARPLERLVVKVEDRWLPLPLRAVRRLSAEGKQVRVYAGADQYLLRRSLQELETRLDPRRFMRVHRSEIIALDAVAHLEPWDHGDALLVLKEGGHVVLSRTYRKAFLERWGMEG